MVKHTLVSAAAALVLSLGMVGATTGDALAQHRGGHGGYMWPRGGWHGGGGGWHGGGGGWHGGGWRGGGWHGGGWNGGGWNGGCWNCGWNGGWGWGWGPAFGLGLGLGYGAGVWDNGATRVCRPVVRNVRVHTSHGWRWRNVVVGRRCFWVDNGW